MSKEEFVESLTSNIEDVLNDYIFNNHKNQIIARRLSAEFTKTYNEEFLWDRALFLSTSSCILLNENTNKKIATKALKESAEVYEYLGTVSEQYDKDYSMILASMCYDLAGYQANAQCLIKNLLDYDLKGGNYKNEINDDNYILNHIKLILNKNIPKAKSLINNNESSSFGVILFNEAVEKWYDNILSFSETNFQDSVNQAYQYYLNNHNIHISHLLFLLKARFEIFIERSVWENLRQDLTIVENPIWRKYIKLLTHDLYAGNSLKNINDRVSKFEFWISQLRAFQHNVLSDNNFVIQMPTSAGKTFIAEICILKRLIQYPNKKCIYVAPFRALTNEKEVELSAQISKLGFSVSSLSGSYELDEYQDIILEDTDVLIATPEKIDLLFRLNPEYFNNISLMVVDEGHIVGDISTRSSLLEFLLIRIKARTNELKTVFISAVMPPANADEYSLWLSGQENNVIRSLAFSDSPIDDQWEPTRKLIGNFTWEGINGRISFANIETEDEKTKIKRGAFVPSIIKRNQYGGIYPNGSTKAQTSASLAFELSKDGQCLVFCAQVPNTKQVGDALLNIISILEETVGLNHPHLSRNQNRESYFFASKWFTPDSYIIKCLERGIGVHFGDLPEPVRRAVESDYCSGNLKVLISTNTIGQGLNFPIKHLIIHSTLINQGLPVKIRDFWNIVGRAGRACKETEGQIIFVINSYTDKMAYLEYIDRGNIEPAYSMFFQVLSGLNTRIDQNTFENYIRILSEPYLLNLLVEESVETETETLIQTIIGNSLFKIQSEKHGLNINPIKEVFRKTIISTREEFSLEVIKVFGETGFSIASNKAIDDFIESNKEDIKSIIIEDNYIRLLELILEIFSEDKIDEVYIDKFSKTNIKHSDCLETLLLWISGREIDELQREWQTISNNPALLNILISQGFYYRYAWGITSFITIMSFRLELERSELPEGIKSLPSYVKYGLNNPTACLARSIGIKNRDVAIILSERSDSLTGRAFIKWVSNLTSEDIATFRFNQYDTRNVINIAAALSPNRYDIVPDFFEFNVRGTSYDEERRTISLTINIGDTLSYVRDRLNPYDPFAIKLLSNGVQVGFVPREISKIIAVEIDINNAIYNIIVTGSTPSSISNQLSFSDFNQLIVRLSKINH